MNTASFKVDLLGEYHEGKKHYKDTFNSNKSIGTASHAFKYRKKDAAFPRYGKAIPGRRTKDRASSKTTKANTKPAFGATYVKTSQENLQAISEPTK